MTPTAGFERPQTTGYPGVANCLVQQVFWGMPPTIDHAGTQPSCILVVGALEEGSSRAGRPPSPTLSTAPGLCQGHHATWGTVWSHRPPASLGGQGA